MESLVHTHMHASVWWWNIMLLLLLLLLPDFRTAMLRYIGWIHASRFTIHACCSSTATARENTPRLQTDLAAANGGVPSKTSADGAGTLLYEALAGALFALALGFGQMTRPSVVCDRTYRTPSEQVASARLCKTPQKDPTFCGTCL